MENKLEQLLNTLIQRGWKPFGDNAIKLDYDGKKTRYGYGAITYKYRDSYIDDYGDEVEYEEWRHQFNNRELVSKESGLWQFVCENGMVDMKKNKRPAYRIKESALTYESELEDFLLSNIKVDE